MAALRNSLKSIFLISAHWEKETLPPIPHWKFLAGLSAYRDEQLRTNQLVQSGNSLKNTWMSQEVDKWLGSVGYFTYSYKWIILGL